MEALLATWSPIAIISFALAPIIIAAIALGAAIWSGVEQRKHNRLSVKPFLEYEWDTDAISLVNSGLGPGKVDILTATVNGQTYDITTTDGVTRLANEQFPSLSGTTVSIGSGCQLVAQAKFKFIKFGPSDIDGRALTELMKTFEFRAEFWSIYGEWFESYGRTS